MPVHLRDENKTQSSLNWVSICRAINRRRRPQFYVLNRFWVVRVQLAHWLVLAWLTPNAQNLYLPNTTNYRLLRKWYSTDIMRERCQYLLTRYIQMTAIFLKTDRRTTCSSLGRWNTNQKLKVMSRPFLHFFGDFSWRLVARRWHRNTLSLSGQTTQKASHDFFGLLLVFL